MRAIFAKICPILNGHNVCYYAGIHSYIFHPLLPTILSHTNFPLDFFSTLDISFIV